MKRRKIIIALLSAISMNTIRAQEINPEKDFYAPGKRIGVGISVGVLDGIGIEGAVSLSKWCSGRVGVNFMPNFHYTYTDNYYFTLQGNIEDINAFLETKGVNPISPYTNFSVTGAIPRVQMHVLFDVYPFTNKSSFFITAGFYFCSKKIVKVSGNLGIWPKILKVKEVLQGSPYSIDGINIAGFNVPLDDNGDLYAGIAGSGFRPYVGLGFGRAIPKKRIGFRFELGLQFHGSLGLVDRDNEPLFKNLNDKAQGDIKDIVDKLTILPILKFSIRGRIL